MTDLVTEQATRAPAPCLRPYIDRYVGYHFAGFGPGTHTGLPSQHLTLIVSLDEPVDLARMPDPSQPAAAFGALVGGLHSSPVTVRHDGVQHGVQLGIKPLGARALLEMPAAELASAVVSLDDVIGRLAHELRDRLRSVGGWDARFAVIDDVLTRALTEPRRSIRPELAESWRVLRQSCGTVDVGALAKRVGWSRRHLSAQFRAEFGLTPKVAARVLRFERSRSILVQPNRPSFAEIAAACGYADQAHMARDWRELAGASPSGWLAAEQFPFVQDTEGVDGAS